MEFHNIAETTILKHSKLLKADSDKLFIHLVNSRKCQENIVWFWDSLSSEEKDWAKGCYNSELRNKYIIAHGVLRCILAYYTGNLPVDIKYTHNKYGKPFLEDSNLQFNMSHSSDLIGYIAAFDQKVGIDIEYHNVNIKPEEFYENAFTEKEQQFINSSDNYQRYKNFYDIWTKKEAIVKAIGSGLSYPINSIETLQDGQVVSGSAITTVDEDELRYWQSQALNVKQHYSAAIAVEMK